VAPKAELPVDNANQMAGHGRRLDPNRGCPKVDQKACPSLGQANRICSVPCYERVRLRENSAMSAMLQVPFFQVCVPVAPCVKIAASRCEMGAVVYPPRRDNSFIQQSSQSNMVELIYCSGRGTSTLPANHRRFLCGDQKMIGRSRSTYSDIKNGVQSSEAFAQELAKMRSTGRSRKPRCGPLMGFD